mgnify:CR=1 FL=1
MSGEIPIAWITGISKKVQMMQEEVIGTSVSYIIRSIIRVTSSPVVVFWPTIWISAIFSGRFLIRPSLPTIKHNFTRTTVTMVMMPIFRCGRLGKRLWPMRIT